MKIYYEYVNYLKQLVCCKKEAITRGSLEILLKFEQ